MRYRLSVFAFFLLFIPLGSMGQEHWWKGDSVLYDKEILLSNPVLLSLGKIDKSVDAGFAYTRLKPVPEHWAGYPEEVSRWRFKAEGITRVGRFCGSGMAAFSRMHEKDLSFRLTNHSELFYPFIVADTVCIALFFFQQMYLTSLLFVVYDIMGIAGYFRWRRQLSTQ